MFVPAFLCKNGHKSTFSLYHESGLDSNLPADYDGNRWEVVFVSIYLDHAATTPVDERVIEAMTRCMRESFANPSAAYSAAGHARKAQRMARQTVARLLGCDQNEVFFTSGGTEGNNWAMQAARGKHAVVSAIEHASVLEAAKAYAAEVTLALPDADGVIQPEAVASAIRPDTALVSVQWANNETGVLQPVHEIARIAHKHGALFHADAVQAFGHVAVDVENIDLLTISAHKFYGPRGAGCLYVKSGTRLSPLLHGGGQESGLRAGTENTPAIYGLGMAAELAEADMAERAEREQALLDLFVQALSGCSVSVLGGERLPSVLALFIPGRESEELIAKLDLKGIQVSGGAACAAGSNQASHVYRAMGLSERDARCVLRVSVGRGNTSEQMIAAASALRQLILA